MTVKVIHWGLGAMGGGIARLLDTKIGVESVATIDADPNKQGKTMAELLGVKSQAVIGDDPAHCHRFFY